MAAMAIAPAFAVDVTYNTVGTFGSSGTNVLHGAGGLSITYGDLTNAVVNPPVLTPTTASFGQFTASGLTGSDVITDTFSLAVTQSVPAPGGTETLTDTFNGTIQTSFSNVTLNFNAGTGGGGVAVLDSDPITHQAAFRFTFGNVEYWVDEVTGIVPSTTNGGVSTIQGAIEVLPEPAFYGLTGTGFAGLLLMALRRRSQASAQASA
jgi:hypothetical protein